MSIISFGEYTEGKSYKTVDEHQMKANASVMLIVGIIAFMNGFMLQNYIALPFITGFLVVNFMIGLFINPKFSPTMIIAKIMTKDKEPLPIGAIQKKFAWSLGLILTATIFVLSIMLLEKPELFNTLCMLCLVCITILYFESVFGVCIGCKLYQLALKMKLIKAPEDRPNCMGDGCDITPPTQA